MNTHRIALDVGARYFSQNPVGALHHAVSESSIARLRRELAVDVAQTPKHETAPRLDPYAAAWRVSVAASQATRLLHTVDNAIDNAFGTCLAMRPLGRPAWESEGLLAQLGKVPLHGLTLLGAHLGAAYAGARGTNKYRAEHEGARLGALVGGSLAYLWSQGMALTGFAVKMAIRIPTTTYLAFVQMFDPMELTLAGDALRGTASRLNPLRAS